MEKIKVLFVDDDLEFGHIATKILQAADYEVYFQNSLFGIENNIMKLNPNIIILDVMVGEENSLERINDIKLAAEDIPIIFVSSDHDVETEEQATENGAVVYLEKPFDKEKLLLWVKRYAKSNDFSNSRQINIGAYTIDTESHILRYCGNNEKTLSNTEFATFKLLWINKGNVVSRQEFKNTVWKSIFCSDENLNNVVYNLRRYFSKDASIHLETIRGEGFKMWIEDYSA